MEPLFKPKVGVRRFRTAAIPDRRSGLCTGSYAAGTADGAVSVFKQTRCTKVRKHSKRTVSGVRQRIETPLADGAPSGPGSDRSSDRSDRSGDRSDRSGDREGAE